MDATPYDYCLLPVVSEPDCDKVPGCFVTRREYIFAAKSIVLGTTSDTLAATSQNKRPDNAGCAAMRTFGFL